MKNQIPTIILASILLFLLSCGNEINNGENESKSSVIKERPNSEKEDDNDKVKSEKKEIPVEDLSVPPEQLEKSKEIIGRVKDEEMESIDVAMLFKLSCSTCHGTTGNLMANGAKDLTKSKISLEESVAQIYFGKGMMLPYADALSEAEIVALAKYAEGFRK